MEPVDSSNLSSEIIVVGAGLAGSTLAAVLGQLGRRVILVDSRSACPPVFKAEKIDVRQVQLLRKFGLLERLLEHSFRWNEVRLGYDGHIFKTIRVEQYGINYADMVNALRAKMPPAVDCRRGQVELIANSEHMQRVRLSGGEELTARLVVLASGVSGGLEANLGLRRRVVRRDQSLVLGFDVAASLAQPFAFDSVAYYSVQPVDAHRLSDAFQVPQRDARKPLCVSFRVRSLGSRVYFGAGPDAPPPST